MAKHPDEYQVEHLPEIMGRVSSPDKKPVGRPEATHSLENARDISISVKPLGHGPRPHTELIVWSLFVEA